MAEVEQLKQTGNAVSPLSPNTINLTDDFHSMLHENIYKIGIHNNIQDQLPTIQTGFEILSKKPSLIEFGNTSPPSSVSSGQPSHNPFLAP